MPIKPENRDKYPKNWAYLRATVLFRAGNRCEGSPRFPECRAVNYAPHPQTGSKVVLTTAHMDHDETNGNLQNLRALCQKCHNAHDAKNRAAGIKQRRRQHDAICELPFEEPVKAVQESFAL